MQFWDLPSARRTPRSATGVITVYRATGIINFAQGAMALWAAYVCTYLRVHGRLVLPIGTVKFSHPLSLWPALVIAVITADTSGADRACRCVSLAPTGSRAAQVVASVGLMLPIQALIIVRFGTAGTQPLNVLPSGGITVSGTQISDGPLLLTGIVTVMAVAVFVYFTQTKQGIATRAGAENERALILAGYSPSRLAAIAWMLAAAIGGITAILASPATSLDPTTYVLIIVPVLAVALIGRLDRIGVAVVSGLALGALETALAYLTGKPWWPSWAVNGLGYALPFVIIVIVLFIAGKRVPARGTGRHRGFAPGADPTRAPPGRSGPGSGGGCPAASNQWHVPFRARETYIFILLGMSLVVITGYVGQISLCQMTFAGTAGFTLSKFATTLGIPFPLSPLLACLAATVVGLVVGIPALRIRGATGGGHASSRCGL